MKACLGIDTSCYTTSAALCWFDDRAADGLFFQRRTPLAVKPGERGLMQSAAVFQHVANLPACLEALRAERPEAEIALVCASERPRPRDDSYMPVFRVGAGMGRAIAASLSVPYVGATHQEGHLRAARVGTALDAKAPYLALHLSGGTTELLLAEGGDIRLLGGTGDLHAGQLIDRVGVRMGLPFPAGPALERLAFAGEARQTLPATVRGMTCHFSGAETRALKALDAGASLENLAAEVFDCVARTVARLVVRGAEETGCQDILVAGGVAASALVKTIALDRVAKRRRDLRLYFSRPDLSGDNAVGIGLLGIERLRRECGEE